MARSFRHLSLVAACVFFLWQSPLWGQTGAGLVPQPAFTVIAVGDSPAWDNLYYLTGPGKAVKLAFARNRRSVSVAAATGAKTLVFGVERIDQTTKLKTYVPVAEAVWPQGAAKVLCVFAVVGGATPQLGVIACDDGLKAFPLRSARVFNATGVSLMARIASHDEVLPPGISPGYAYPVTSTDPTRVGSFPLAFAMRSGGSSGARLLYSGYGEAWATGRCLVFVTAVPQHQPPAVQVRIVVDTPPVPKA